MANNYYLKLIHGGSYDKIIKKESKIDSYIVNICEFYKGCYLESIIRKCSLYPKVIYKEKLVRIWLDNFNCQMHVEKSNKLLIKFSEFNQLTSIDFYANLNFNDTCLISKNVFFIIGVTDIDNYDLFICLEGCDSKLRTFYDFNKTSTLSLGISCLKHILYENKDITFSKLKGFPFYCKFICKFNINKDMINLLLSKNKNNIIEYLKNYISINDDCNYKLYKDVIKDKIIIDKVVDDC